VINVLAKLSKNVQKTMQFSASQSQN